MARVDLSDILRLPVEDRIAIAQQIWDSVVAEQADIPLTEEQREELDKRLAEHRADPTSARDAAEVMDELRIRYGGGSDTVPGADGA